VFEDLILELQPFATALLQAVGQARLSPRVTSTRRSQAAQVKLYRRYVAGLSPFPAAPPGTSAHEFGYAFDLVVSPFEALLDVGYTWQTWGGLWGGQRDPVHFEYPGFVVPSQTRATVLSEAVGFVPGLTPVSIAQAVIEPQTPTFVYDPKRTFTWADFFDPFHAFH